MSEPIRILNIFMVLDRGGAETFVMNVYRQIDRTKVQFDFLVHGDKVGSYEEEIIRLGGRIYRLPKMTEVHSYKHSVRNFFDEHPHYKIIHSHASELGLLIFKEAKKRGIPYRICHAHSAPKGIGLKTPIRYLFKKRMAHYSNVFLACSKSAGVWQFGKKKDFMIIKNGIAVNEFVFNEKSRNDIRKELGIENKLVIGHVGRFEKPKNHIFLVNIFENVLKYSDAVLLLIGDGSLKSEIERNVTDKGIVDKVIFLGAQRQVAPYLSAMDCFVFPSLFEGLGIVLIEAQANGLKCFISDTIPEETNISTLTKRLSLCAPPDEWAKAIVNNCFSVSGRDKFANQVIVSGYDIKETVEQLQDLYLSLYRS